MMRLQEKRAIKVEISGICTVPVITSLDQNYFLQLSLDLTTKKIFSLQLGSWGTFGLRRLKFENGLGSGQSSRED